MRSKTSRCSAGMMEGVLPSLVSTHQFRFRDGVLLYNLEEISLSDPLEAVGVKRIEPKVVSVRSRWRTGATVLFPAKIVPNLSGAGWKRAPLNSRDVLRYVVDKPVDERSTRSIWIGHTQSEAPCLFRCMLPV